VIVPLIKKCSVFAIFNLSSAFIVFDTRQNICRVFEKILDKKPFINKIFVRCSFPSITFDKDFAEYKKAFIECLRHSAKKTSSIVS
jgi:hypothetical protein